MSDTNSRFIISHHLRERQALYLTFSGATFELTLIPLFLSPEVMSLCQPAGTAVHLKKVTLGGVGHSHGNEVL